MIYDLLNMVCLLFWGKWWTELGEPNSVATEWSDDVTSPEAERTSRTNPQCNHKHDSGGEIQNGGSWGNFDHHWIHKGNLWSSLNNRKKNISILYRIFFWGSSLFLASEILLVSLVYWIKKQPLAFEVKLSLCRKAGIHSTEAAIFSL